MRVLLIEDDESLRKSIAQKLRAELFVVDEAIDGEEGLYAAEEFPIDLAIVDLGLPGMSGLDIIKTLRKKQKSFPILILTARDRWQDKVLGLESGADDYMIKPFQMEEVLARVRALIRRASGWSEAVLTAGPLELRPASQEVLVQNSPVEVTAYEYKIIEYLMLHAGEVVSKTELTDHVYAQDSDRDSNVIEVLVGRLRKKLNPKGVKSLDHLIETLRGRGYRLTLTKK